MMMMKKMEMPSNNMVSINKCITQQLIVKRKTIQVLIKYKKCLMKKMVVSMEAKDYRDSNRRLDRITMR